MRLTIIFMTVLFLNVNASGVSQTVTISGKDMTLEKIFSEIKKQAGFIFFYDYDLVQRTHPVTLDMKNQSVEKVLNVAFKGQGLSWSVSDQTIAIKKAVPLPIANMPSASMLVPPINFKGRVLGDAGEPLEGVTVTVKSTRKATSTDVNGYFELKGVDEAAVIVISGVNIMPYEMNIRGKNNVSVTVKKKIVEDETITVMSNGYQRIPQERITGAFTNISAADLDKTNSFNLKDRLEGMVPGMYFEPHFDEDQTLNGSTDRSRSMVIRGVGTFSDNNPLIVIDGAPYYTAIIDPWTLINPADVESITVLKDAAAASIWGSQAANGVIVITTKKGTARKGQPILSVSLDYLVQPVPNLMNGIPWASSKDAIGIYKRMVMNEDWFDALLPGSGGIELPEVMRVILDMKNGSITTDAGNKRLAELEKIDVRREFKELFFRKLETNKKVNLAFQTGNEVHQVRTSLTGTFVDGYARGNSDMQLTANLTDEYSPKKWLKFSFGTNVFLSNIKQNGPVVNDLTNIPQMSRILDDDGSYLPMTFQNTQESYYSFPYWNRRDTVAKYKLPYDWEWNLKREADNTDKSVKTTSLRLFSNLSLTPFKGLVVDFFYQYQNDHVLRKEYYNESSWYVRNLVNNNTSTTGAYPVPPGGMLYNNDRSGSTHNGRLQVSYTRTVGDHAVRALAGMEVRKIYADLVPYGFYGYDPQSLTNSTNINYFDPILVKRSGIAGFWNNIPPVPTLYSGIVQLGGEDERYVSNYGNIGYTFKNRYDLTGSIRYDRTNLWGQGSELSNLPQWSVGAGWKISDEAFFKVPFMDLLKLRVSYGFNGLTDRSASPFIIGYPWNDPITRLPYAAVQSAPNPTLTWERTGTYNIGIDFAFLNNRFNGGVDIYSKKATDVLAQIAVNGTYGFQNNRASLNTGNINNNGLELHITANILERTQIKWQSRFNYGTNRNRAFNITSVNKSISAYTSLAWLYHIPDAPVDYIAAATWAGYDAAGLDRFYYQGKVYSATDIPNSSTLNAADLFPVVGQRSPKHYGQWANTISYKGFDLNISLLYKFGHKFVADYPPTGVLTTYFTPSKFFTFLPELMVNSWKSPEDVDASMYSIDNKLTGANTTIINSYQTMLDFISRYSSRNVKDAGSVRLQSISLAYRIPAKVSGVLKNARLQFEARNLGPIFVSNKDGIDPDFPPASSSVYGALQYVVRNRPQYSVSLRFGL